MAVKSKVKARSTPKKLKTAKSKAKSKEAVKKPVSARKTISTTKPKVKKTVKTKQSASSTKPQVKKAIKRAKPGQIKSTSELPPAAEKSAVKAQAAVRPMAGLQVVKRTVNPFGERKKTASPASLRASQFSFMKAPIPEHAFEVGDTVEVFCDHEKSRERVRGWIKGIVVQVDNKMVAVQFRSNVFLTDGWMVPDRILWYPLASEHIRPVGKKAALKKELIPDY